MIYRGLGDSNIRGSFLRDRAPRILLGSYSPIFLIFRQRVAALLCIFLFATLAKTYSGLPLLFRTALTAPSFFFTSSFSDCASATWAMMSVLLLEGRQRLHDCADGDISNQRSRLPCHL